MKMKHFFPEKLGQKWGGGCYTQQNTMCSVPVGGKISLALAPCCFEESSSSLWGHKERAGDHVQVTLDLVALGRHPLFLTPGVSNSFSPGATSASRLPSKGRT